MCDGELNGDHTNNEDEDGHVTHVYGSDFHSEHNPGTRLEFSVEYAMVWWHSRAKLNRVFVCVSAYFVYCITYISVPFHIRFIP